MIPIIDCCPQDICETRTIKRDHSCAKFALLHHHPFFKCVLIGLSQGTRDSCPPLLSPHYTAMCPQVARSEILPKAATLSEFLFFFFLLLFGGGGYACTTTHESGSEDNLRMSSGLMTQPTESSCRLSVFSEFRLWSLTGFTSEFYAVWTRWPLTSLMTPLSLSGKRLCEIIRHTVGAH